MSNSEQNRANRDDEGARPTSTSQGTQLLLYVDEEAERYESQDRELQNLPLDERREAISVFSGCYVDLSARDHNAQSWRLRRETSATEIGRQLAVLASELERENADMFDECINSHNKANEDFFSDVAIGLFRKGPTYGKIVTLLAFGYRFLKRNLLTAAQTIGLVIGSLVKTLFSMRVVDWLKQSGGWAAMVSKSYTGQVLCGVTAVVLVASFVYFKWYRSA